MKIIVRSIYSTRSIEELEMELRRPGINPDFKKDIEKEILTRKRKDSNNSLSIVNMERGIIRNLFFLGKIGSK